MSECTFTHLDGCLTETTWDDGDCTCRCPVCNQPVRSDGKCRWAPKGHATRPAAGGDSA